tara:strand:+ start:910 stop:1605 length:696 start_codon:yes stop_codon:yes gene_type:complete
MTVLSAIQEATTVIGLTKPTGVFASVEREHIELADVANDIAERIANAHEWGDLTTLATITGDASTEDWDMPADYDRMLTKANLWSSSLETPLSHILDIDEWLGLEVQAFSHVINAWCKFGGQIHIKPALPDGVTAKYYYQSNLIVTPTAGANKARFTADTDVFRLDEQLLRLGIIYQWRANKGLPNAEDMANFEDRKEKLISRDKGSRILRVGRVRMPSGLKVAYPQNITS